MTSHACLFQFLVFALLFASSGVALPHAYPSNSSPAVRSTEQETSLVATPSLLRRDLPGFLTTAENKIPTVLDGEWVRETLKFGSNSKIKIPLKIGDSQGRNTAFAELLEKSHAIPRKDVVRYGEQAHVKIERKVDKLTKGSENDDGVQVAENTVGLSGRHPATDAEALRQQEAQLEAQRRALEKGEDNETAAYIRKKMIKSHKNTVKYIKQIQDEQRKLQESLDEENRADRKLAEERDRMAAALGNLDPRPPSTGISGKLRKFGSTVGAPFRDPSLIKPSLSLTRNFRLTGKGSATKVDRGTGMSDVSTSRAGSSPSSPRSEYSFFSPASTFSPRLSSGGSSRPMSEANGYPIYQSDGSVRSPVRSPYFGSATSSYRSQSPPFLSQSSSFPSYSPSFASPASSFRSLGPASPQTANRVLQNGRPSIPAARFRSQYAAGRSGGFTLDYSRTPSSLSRTNSWGARLPDSPVSPLSNGVLTQQRGKGPLRLDDSRRWAV